MLYQILGSFDQELYAQRTCILIDLLVTRLKTASSCIVMLKIKQALKRGYRNKEVKTSFLTNAEDGGRKKETISHVEKLTQMVPPLPSNKNRWMNKQTNKRTNKYISYETSYTKTVITVDLTVNQKIIIYLWVNGSLGRMSLPIAKKQLLNILWPPPTSSPPPARLICLPIPPATFILKLNNEMPLSLGNFKLV